MTGKKGPVRYLSNSGPGPATMPWGVVLLAHGSQRGTDRSDCSCFWDGTETVTPAWCRRCPSTPQGLQDAAERLQKALGLHGQQLVLSCLEFIQPHPDEAVRILEGRGFRRVAIVPFLLGIGKHATVELDEVLDRLRLAMPQVQLHLAECLGADPRLAELVVERLRGRGSLPEARPDVRRPTGVLLVKAGTKTLYDDCLWLKELGQQVEQRLGPGYAVAVAQSHYGDPTIESAAAHLVGERRASSIVCVPYLMFPGIILRRNVLGGMDLLRARYPGLPMTVTPPLGVDDRLVSLTAEKVQEVWARAEPNGPQPALQLDMAPRCGPE